MPDLPPLSPRLARMLQFLATAKTEKQIAAELKISPHTVHSRIRDVYAVFGVRSRLQLMAMMLRNCAQIPDSDESQ